MEVFGTIAAAIDLVQKIKNTFDQTKRNRKEGYDISAEIVDSLLRIEDLLKHHSFINSPQLRDDLSNFQNLLHTTLIRREALMKRSGDGYWDLSMKKLKEMYYAEDIKDGLTELRHRIQDCHRNLQTKCAVRTDDGVANANAQLEALRSLFSENQKILARIEDKVGDRISKAEHDTQQAQTLVGVRNMNIDEASQSLKETKEVLLLRGSTSDMEAKYLRLKVKALTEAIPELHARTSNVNKSPISLGTGPIRSIEWVTHYNRISNPDKTREDSAQKMIRMLSLLRSGEGLSYVQTTEDLLVLGWMLDDLGMLEESVDIRTQEVQIRRELANGGNSKFMMDLAHSLSNLSYTLVEMGRYMDGLSASDESVNIYRGLDGNNSSEFLDGLASSLLNHALALSHLGRYEAAVVVARESVDYNRKLVKEGSGGFLPDLAQALGNLSFFLSQLGRHEEALQGSEEPIDIYRELIKDEPISFLPFLAFYLSSQSQILNTLGRHNDALRVSQESVDIYYAVIQVRPIPPWICKVFPLHSLAISLYKLGRHEEALRRIEEALNSYVESGNPELDQDNTAKYFDTRALCLSSLGQHDKAVEVGGEVLKISRSLDIVRPVVYGGSVAEYLLHHSRALYNKGDVSEAKSTVEECIGRYQTLARTMPLRYDLGLREALKHQSQVLITLGIRSAPAEPSGEAPGVCSS